MPSESFQKQEEQAEKAQEQRAESKVVQEENENIEYFWAHSAKHQIANFEKEEFSGGRMIKREKPLRATCHVYTARTEKERQFLRASNAFRDGGIILCKDLAEAHMRTVKHNQLKGIKEVRCESISSSMITEQPDGKYTETREPDKVKYGG